MVLPGRYAALRWSWALRNPGPSTCAIRTQSTIASETRVAPLLLKIKSDLKEAMKAKDKARLDVLRSVIAESTNAAKASKPIETDVQLLALLKKRIATGKDAAAQFQAANRNDLYEKEMSQVEIVGEYASFVRVLGQEQVDAIITAAIKQQQETGAQINVGALMKSLFGPSGALAEQPVDRAAVASRVKALAQS